MILGMNKLTYEKIEAANIELAAHAIVAINTAKQLGWSFTKDPAMGRMWIAYHSDYDKTITSGTIEGALRDIADYEAERAEDARLDRKCVQLNALPERFRALPGRFGRGR